MKNIFFILISLTFIIISCSKGEDYKNTSKNEVISKAYGIESLEENQKIPALQSLKNEIGLEENGYKVILNKEKSKIVYAIPFKEDDKKFLLTDNTNKKVIIDINIDKEGNGDVTLISDNIKTIKFFKNKKLVEVEKFEKVNTYHLYRNINNFNDDLDWKLYAKSSNSFRECFDQAYDDVCDGFWGCIAWHTHPVIPVMASVICSFS